MSSNTKRSASRQEPPPPRTQRNQTQSQSAVHLPLMRRVDMALALLEAAMSPTTGTPTTRIGNLHRAPPRNILLIFASRGLQPRGNQFTRRRGAAIIRAGGAFWVPSYSHSPSVMGANSQTTCKPQDL
eukprot:scaffold264205_cov27-Tisochrysis_lutea.AAC.1